MNKKINLLDLDFEKISEFWLRYKDNPQLLIKEHSEYKEEVIGKFLCGIKLKPKNAEFKMNKYNEWLFKLAFIDTSNWRETIPALILIGALQFGTSEKAKKKIMNWMGLKYAWGMKGKVLYFFRCWKRLEENGIFKDGKINANLKGENSAIEFALLMLIAQGLIERREATIYGQFIW